MCGRAKLPDDVSENKLDLKIDFDEIGDYRPRWNAAPTSKLPVVISAAGSRILTLMRWALSSKSAIRLLTPALAGRPALVCPRRWLLRMAQCRQAAVRDRACQPRPNDAGRCARR